MERISVGAAMLLGLFTLAGGCAEEHAPLPGPTGASSDAITVEESYLRGELGELEFNTVADEVRITEATDDLRIALLAEVDHGIVMMVVYLEPAWLVQANEDGTEVRPPLATILGCSGPQYGYWDIDETTEEPMVVLTPGETPGTVAVELFGAWPYSGRSQQVETGFLVAAPWLE